MSEVLDNQNTAPRKSSSSVVNYGLEHRSTVRTTTTKSGVDSMVGQDQLMGNPNFGGHQSNPQYQLVNDKGENVDPDLEKRQRICGIVGTGIVGIVAVLLWVFVIYACFTQFKD